MDSEAGQNRDAAEPGGEVRQLREELAGVARETARLLLRPRYDEAELAELDVRARDLRARLRALAPPRREPPAELFPYYGSRTVSGG
jgi:hypothetical protein